jgi:hypothetical protein
MAFMREYTFEHHPALCLDMFDQLFFVDDAGTVFTGFDFNQHLNRLRFIAEYGFQLVNLDRIVDAQPDLVLAGELADSLQFANATIWLAMKMSDSPAAAMTSASPTLATVMPVAPAAPCSLANSGILCVLVWDRRATPYLSAFAFIAAMLPRTRSMSMSRNGVSS